MPSFTIPTSDKVQGSPNFPADIGNAYGALAALASGNAFNSAYAGGADPLGGSDSTAAIAAALATGLCVLPPGTYMVSGLAMPARSVLWAYGATLVPSPASAPGTPMVTLATGCRALGVHFYGGSAATSSNPACDLIGTTPGATDWAVADVSANNCNGSLINPAMTGSLHGSIRGIRASACAAGIKLVQGSGNSTVAAEINMADVNIQSCTSGPALTLQGVTDVIGSALNFSVDGSKNSGPTVLIAGKGGGFLSGIDWGVTKGGVAGVPVLAVEDAGGGSPSNWDLNGGSIQQGGIGVRVSGGAARLRFRGILAQQCLGDGWQFTGTGSAITVADCMANSNNSAAGIAYDVNVTSTAHVGLFNFAYCSTGVTNALIFSATNHVTNANPTYPGGKTMVGTPSGW